MPKPYSKSIHKVADCNPPLPKPQNGHYISRIFLDEQITAKRQRMAKFLVKFIELGSFAQRPKSGRLSQVTGKVRKFVKESMHKDDKTMLKELQH